MKRISETVRAECQKDKEAAVESLQHENAKLSQELQHFKALETELSVAKSELAKSSSAHCNAISALTSQHDAAMAIIRSEHDSDARGWEAALARHRSTSDLFKYVVRGCPAPMLTGSVPHSIFQAEPDSALAQTYNGAWDYAKDEQGRAVVNSNPEHWPIILDWLSFGTVPSSPSDGLIAECRYWQLDRLLAAIKAAKDSSSKDLLPAPTSHDLEVLPALKDGHAGFSVQGLIYHFPKRLSAAVDKSHLIRIPFTAAGRDWLLDLCQKSFHLSLSSGPPLTKAWWRVEIGSGEGAVIKLSTAERVFEAKKSWGWDWLPASNVQKLMHPGMLTIEGSLKIAMTLTFK